MSMLTEMRSDDNLHRAWRWLRSNADANYKGYFRDLYCPASVGIGEPRRLSYTYGVIPDGGSSNAERATEFQWG